MLGHQRTGLTGKLKTARKGVGDFTVTVGGVASHAGVDFSAGASAVVELARQIERIANCRSTPRHHSKPGSDFGRHAIQRSGRTRHRRDRFSRGAPEGCLRLENQFARLKLFDKRCTLDITGGLNRPPMERSRGIVQLFRTAQRLGRALGVEVGGVDDPEAVPTATSAALGIPTLDGIGAVGEGAHAVNEYSHRPYRRSHRLLAGIGERLSRNYFLPVAEPRPVMVRRNRLPPASRACRWSVKTSWCHTAGTLFVQDGCQIPTADTSAYCH